MHFFNTPGEREGQGHLKQGREYRSESSEVDRMLRISRLHLHKREQAVDGEYEFIRKIQIEFIQDEKK